MNKDLYYFLMDKGIHVISSRRFRLNDGRPYVESDYDGIGVEVADYFCSVKCSEITFFSHFEPNCGALEADLNGYPMGLKNGISRGFEMKGVSSRIKVCVNKEESAETSACICRALQDSPPSNGIVFTNGYQLLELFEDIGEKAKNLLLGRNIVVISNKTINVKLERFVGGLNLMVLLDTYEETGKLMVSKLMSMIEGYFEGASTTLVNIQFERFDNLVKSGT